MELNEEKMREFLKEYDIPLDEYKTFKNNDCAALLCKSDTEFIKVFTMDKIFMLQVVEVHEKGKIETFMFGERYQNKMKYEFFTDGNGIIFVTKNGRFLGYRRKILNYVSIVSVDVGNIKKAFDLFLPF